MAKIKAKTVEQPVVVDLGEILEDRRARNIERREQERSEQLRLRREQAEREVAAARRR